MINNKCHDCGAREGELHKFGCDMERRPKCNGQRIPWIHYPNICQKCGKVYPDIFMVDSLVWKKYIQEDMRDKIICRECFDFIKKVIDENSTFII